MKEIYSKKNYYKAGEAQARLGIDKNKFNYLVRTGRIKKHTPPGSAQGLYLKTEIDKLAREWLAFMVYNEEHGLRFMKAIDEEDLKEEHELATLMFGNVIHNMEIRLAWLAKNPDIDFIVRDHGRLVGFLNILPAKHEAIIKFMKGEIRGWDIKPEDVLPFTPGSTMECILMGMGTTPDVEPIRRAQYGSKLISGFIEFLCELAQQNITITKFYATSATPSGISILRNAGFTEIGRIGKRIAFEIDIMKSNSPIAVEYRKALSEAQEAEQLQTLK